jgi:hypothetical protein
MGTERAEKSGSGREIEELRAAAATDRNRERAGEKQRRRAENRTGASSFGVAAPYFRGPHPRGLQGGGDGLAGRDPAHPPLLVRSSPPICAGPRGCDPGDGLGDAPSPAPYSSAPCSVTQ